MKKKFRSNRVSSPASESKTVSARAGVGGRAGVGRSVENGLLRLCEEVAGRLLKRCCEANDPERAVREMRAALMSKLGCDGVRAGRIVDLALELLHVKAHGRFKRNPLELSQLIAFAGNQLRSVSDN